MIATGRLFYTHGFEVILIIAILFTLIGILVGWLLWRHCKEHAERIDSANTALQKRCDELRREGDGTEKQIDELEVST